MPYSLALALAAGAADAGAHARGDDAGAPRGRARPPRAAPHPPRAGADAGRPRVRRGGAGRGLAGARCCPARRARCRAQPLLGLTLAAVPLLALGVVDDLRGTGPWTKLVGAGVRGDGAGAVRLRRAAADQPLRRADRAGLPERAPRRGVGAGGGERHQPDRRPRRPRLGRGAHRRGHALVGRALARGLLRHVPRLAADRRHARLPALELPAGARLHGRHRQPVPRPGAGRGRAAREPQGDRGGHAALPAGGPRRAHRGQRAGLRAAAGAAAGTCSRPTASTSTTACSASACRRARPCWCCGRCAPSSA